MGLGWRKPRGRPSDTRFVSGSLQERSCAWRVSPLGLVRILPCQGYARQSPRRHAIVPAAGSLGAVPTRPGVSRVWLSAWLARPPARARMPMGVPVTAAPSARERSGGPVVKARGPPLRSRTCRACVRLLSRSVRPRAANVLAARNRRDYPTLHRAAVASLISRRRPSLSFHLRIARSKRNMARFGARVRP